MSSTSVIEMFAGTQADGSPVAERIQVVEADDESFVLVRSPAFIKGLAKGDQISFDNDDKSFELIKRSGNLCIRVFAREDIEQLAEDMTPEFDKLGGELDFESPRMLVYSIHVSCGFDAIEKILNEHICEDSNSMWLYGNVYDPKDGVTPLNWWHDILKPQ